MSVRIKNALMSKPPTGANYRAVTNLFCIVINGEYIPVWTIADRNNIVVPSFPLGSQVWTKKAITNVYADSSKDINFQVDDRPQQYIQSNPPSGYYKITNIYYDLNTGDVGVEIES